MIIDKNKMSQRAAGLDLFRVVAALMVLLFHCHIHHECNFGPLTGFVSMGAVFMTAFFMLSGYVLYMTYREKSLVQILPLKNFYLKRLIGILPLYYLVSVIYVVSLGTESLLQNIVLLPISHNSGTWFISCLLIAYLFFPLMQEVAKQLATRAKILLLVACALVMFWSPLVVHSFATDSIYANPFFRGLEFFIGVLLCSLSVRLEFLKTWKFFVIEVLVLVAVISAAARLNLFVGNYMLYDVVAVPLFACMIITLSGLKSPRLQNSKVLRYASAVSYAFFLVQTFNTEIENFIFATLDVQNNVLKIALSIALCCLMAVLLHEYGTKRSRDLCSTCRRKLI